jgi:hypothetical protein
MPTRSLQARNELHRHVVLSNAAKVLICDFVPYDGIVGMRPATSCEPAQSPLSRSKPSPDRETA